MKTGPACMYAEPDRKRAFNNSHNLDNLASLERLLWTAAPNVWARAAKSDVYGQRAWFLVCKGPSFLSFLSDSSIKSPAF